MTTIDNGVHADTTEEFAGRMVGAIDSASLAILLSIGHQTSLWDTLAELPPASSAQIADAAGLNERYVREWLGGVVAAAWSNYDPTAQTYSLPRHVPRRSPVPQARDNLARVAQFIPLRAEVEQKVIGCFRSGGGLSYGSIPVSTTSWRKRAGRCSTPRLSTCPPDGGRFLDRLRAGAMSLTSAAAVDMPSM